MQNTDEKLESILESIRHQYQVLVEEYPVVEEQIREMQKMGKDTSDLVQRLRDNLTSRKALYEKIRQTYRDALKIDCGKERI